MSYIVLLAVALVICLLGFYKYVYFISLGYGFSIAGLGTALLIMYRDRLDAATVILSLLFIVYGLRLALFLLYREIKSGSYRSTMKKEIKGNDQVSLGAKFAIYISCALLYTFQVSPVYFRLKNNSGQDAVTIIGAVIMLCGILMEATADLQKNAAKKKAPGRFVSTGLYRMVRCPNYFGEILTWTGVFVSGVTALTGVLQWVIALLGYLGIVYVMFGGARRLEIRQNKNYGSDPEYQAYVKKTPIIIPLVHLYSVEKYKWLVG